MTKLKATPTHSTLPKLVQFGFLILVVLLPLQTLLINFIVNRLGWPAWLAFWKEGLVLIIVCFMLGKIWQKLGLASFSKANFPKLWSIWAFVGAVLVISASSIVQAIPLRLFIFGFRFELFWLGFTAVTMAFLNTQSVDWTKEIGFRKNLQQAVLVGFSLVSLVSIVSIFIGQDKFLDWFGFGQPNFSFLSFSPVSHSVDFSVGGARLSGGFSTPNHLAGYLLLVLPFLIENLRKQLRNRKPRWIILAGLGVVLNLIFIILSFARFAYLGLLTWGLFVLILHFWQEEKFGFLEQNRSTQTPHFTQTKNRVTAIILSLALFLPIFIGLVAINLDPTISSRFLPGFLVKPSSSTLHYRHISAALDVLSQDPTKLLFGYGLGTTGPAAKIEYTNPDQNPIFQKYSHLAYKWGLVGEDLLIPESWYLQLVLNGGIIYAVLYLAILFSPINYLGRTIYYIWQAQPEQTHPFKWSILHASLGFFAVLVGNFFLHIFENQTIVLCWSFLLIFMAWHKDELNNSRLQK
jgi:hypothetical protein